MNITKLSSRLAEILGVSESEVKVNDLAVNPLSGNIYLSIAAGKPTQPAIIQINSKGELSKVSLMCPFSSSFD